MPRINSVQFAHLSAVCPGDIFTLVHVDVSASLFLDVASFSVVWLHPSSFNHSVKGHGSSFCIFLLYIVAQWTSLDVLPHAKCVSLDRWLVVLKLFGLMIFHTLKSYWRFQRTFVCGLCLSVVSMLKIKTNCENMNLIRSPLYVILSYIFIKMCYFFTYVWNIYIFI